MRRHLPHLIIASFLVLMIIGITTGEPNQVLSQAVRICLSCIGIG